MKKIIYTLVCCMFFLTAKMSGQTCSVKINSPSAGICQGSTTTLTASGNGTSPLSYSWSTGATTTMITVSSPGAYYVRLTDGVGCMATDTIVLGILPLPVINISPNQSICLGQCASLTASGGVMYSWTPNACWSNPNINPVACCTTTTNFTVTGTDANNCSNTATTTVFVNPQPVNCVNKTSDTICVGDAYRLCNSCPGTYFCSWTPPIWLDNPNTCCPFASPATTTCYTSTITDLNGCLNTSVFCLVVNPLPCTIGVEETEGATFSVFPNPSKGRMKMVLTKSIVDGRVSLFNAMGMMVYSETFSGKEIEIACRLEPGIYFLELRDAQGVVVRKVVKE